MVPEQKNISSDSRYGKPVLDALWLKASCRRQRHTKRVTLSHKGSQEDKSGRCIVLHLLLRLLPAFAINASLRTATAT